jgi:hypothetical protein
VTDERAWYYDKDGSPLSFTEWGLLCESDEYRRIAKSQCADVWVSTIWMGIDYTWGMGPHRAIFETMVFGEGAWAGYVARYPTEAAARAGHDEVVARISRGQPRGAP